MAQITIDLTPLGGIECHAEGNVPSFTRMADMLDEGVYHGVFWVQTYLRCLAKAYPIPVPAPGSVTPEALAIYYAHEREAHPRRPDRRGEARTHREVIERIRHLDIHSIHADDDFQSILEDIDNLALLQPLAGRE